MAMRSLFSRPSAAVDVVLTRDPLSPEEAAARVRDGAHGAVLVFEGRVRGEEMGEPIRSIEYDAYESMARDVAEGIAREAAARWPVRLAVRHRLGVVGVDEPSFIVACGGGHRGEAFEACRYVVDEVKKRAPIWKVRFEKEASRCSTPAS